MNCELSVLQFLSQMIELDVLFVLENFVVVNCVDLLIAELQLLCQPLKGDVSRELFQNHELAVFNKVPQSVNRRTSF